MTDDLFLREYLCVTVGDTFEIAEPGYGAALARLTEVARVRSPRGNPLTPDAVQAPRLTWALTGSDGTTLLYLDRAEQLRYNMVPPQHAVLAPDGTVLGRIEFDSHSMAHGGGGRSTSDEHGMLLTPAARLLGADDRPICDLVVASPPDGSRPRAANGQDARHARWISLDGVPLAERRDGILRMAADLSRMWRVLIVASFLATTFEFNLPPLKARAPVSAPEPFPGWAGLHAAYDRFQRHHVDEYARPVRTRLGFSYRGGVGSDQLLLMYKIVLPIGFAIVVIGWLVKALTSG